MASNSSVEFTWDTLADLTLQAASWTTNYMHCKNASPGIWQSRATARTKTRFSLAWQANGMLESFVSGFEWAKSSRVVFLCFGRSKGNAVGWPRILEARRQLGLIQWIQICCICTCRFPAKQLQTQTKSAPCAAPWSFSPGFASDLPNLMNLPMQPHSFPCFSILSMPRHHRNHDANGSRPMTSGKCASRSGG